VTFCGFEDSKYFFVHFLGRQKKTKSQKVTEEMAKQKAPSSRRANPEERGVLFRTPQ
jgi:hypothetical protein